MSLSIKSFERLRVDFDQESTEHVLIAQEWAATIAMNIVSPPLIYSAISISIQRRKANKERILLLGSFL